MPMFPRQFGGRDEREELLAQLAAAYKKKNTLDLIGGIAGGVSTMFAPGHVDPTGAANSIRERFGGMGDSRVSQAQEALEAYAALQEQQMQQSHREAQLALQQRGLEQDQSQFDDTLQADLDSQAMRQAELEEQGMLEDSWREKNFGLDQQRLGLSQQEMGIRRQQLQADLQANELAAREKADKRVHEGMGELNKSVGEGAGSFRQNLSEAKRIAAANPKNLPGIGPIAGRLSDKLVSKEGQQLRQSARLMVSDLTKLYSGVGASDKERQSLREATGMVESGDEDAFRQGLQKLEELHNARLGQAYSTQPPEVVDEFKRRNPTLDPAREIGAYKSARRVR